MVKFANAVLRKISREGEQLVHDKTTAMDNIAPWLVMEWNECWGEDKTIKIAEQSLKEPHIDLSINFAPSLSMDERELAMETLRKEFGHENTKVLPNGSLRTGSGMQGALSKWPLYTEGKWWVQDVSSTLPAIALQNSLVELYSGDVSSLHVVDMCAAPVSLSERVFGIRLYDFNSRSFSRK